MVAMKCFTAKSLGTWKMFLNKIPDIGRGNKSAWVNIIRFAKNSFFFNQRGETKKNFKLKIKEPTVEMYKKNM